MALEVVSWWYLIYVVVVVAVVVVVVVGCGGGCYNDRRVLKLLSQCESVSLQSCSGVCLPALSFYNGTYIATIRRCNSLSSHMCKSAISLNYHAPLYLSDRRNVELLNLELRTEIE